MDEDIRLEIFHAQTTNVRELQRAWVQINRHINSAILTKNTTAVQVDTKLLALVYCAFSEALFSKILHTPHGLDLSHIDQIKSAAQSNGIKSAWQKCAELGMQRVESSKSNHGHNALKKLTELIDEYIFDPSVVRNKLAHGQWSIALNRENSAVNAELSKEIEALSVVELYRRKYALEKLAAILEDIIESPNKTHHRDYWIHLTAIEEEQRKMSEWTYGRKAARLLEKKSYATKMF
jgi:hypothetical protein